MFFVQATSGGSTPLVSDNDGQFVSGWDIGAQGEALPKGGASAFVWGVASLLLLGKRPIVWAPTLQKQSLLNLCRPHWVLISTDSC